MWKWVLVLVLSMFKFILGPSIGYAEKLPWITTAIFTALGMMTSVVIFSFMGTELRNKFFKRVNRKKKPIFRKRTRRMVRIWQKYGMQGVAFLTPLLLTPIGGTIIAISFGASKRKIIFYMLPNAIFWAFTLTYLYYYPLNYLLHKP